MNFTETPSIQVPREFLAVILSGFGNELQPLTSNYGDQPCPKALLPIGNKPMISYVLEWVEDAGLKDVLLICPTAHRDAISHHINSDPSSSSMSSVATGLQIDIQTLDQSELPEGTVPVLAHFAHKITGDFVLLPCDFIPPKSLKLETVLDKFRVEASSDGSLASALFFEKAPPVVKEKGKSGGGDADAIDAWGGDDPPPAVMYDEKTGTLLYVDDRDTNDDELELRMATLWKYPRARLTMKLVDAHVYVCRHAVLGALQLKRGYLDSIREEFMPWLCKVATHTTKQRKYGRVLSPSANSASQALALRHSTTQKPTLKKSTATTNSSQTYTSAPSSPTYDEDDEDAVPPSLRVGIVIHRFSDGLALRAHTIISYLELNRVALADAAKIVAAASANTPTLKPSASSKSTKAQAGVAEGGALVDPKANIGPDCLVGASASVGERSTVKRSAVGSHCVIGKGARLTGCVLMEYCVIEDGAKLDGCILGKNTKVGAKAELVRCITQAGFEIKPGASLKNEKLESSDWASRAAEDAEDEDEDEDENDGIEMGNEGSDTE